MNLEQQVVQGGTSPLMIINKILDPLPLLEHTGLDTISLSRVANSEVQSKENVKTYPSCLLVQESPYPNSHGSRISHCPSRRIKSTITSSVVNHSMAE